MTLLHRIAREPNAITGLLVGAYGLAVAFGLFELTAPQVGAVTAFGGALVFALRWLVTPANEVVVQHKPGNVTQTAGPAAPKVPTGEPVHAQITQILGKA